MHRYEPKWPHDRPDWEPPSPWDVTFRDAHDVADYASLEPLTTWYTYPHCWHLDEGGRVHCCSKGSSFDSIRRLAREPAEMVRCRLNPPEDGPCPDFWYVIEPRHPWSVDGDEVTDTDAAAFLSLRRSLGYFGITLLDVVIVTEDFRWWSLHELTSGTTAWSFEPVRAIERARRSSRRNRFPSG
jgi:hypothetical protein